MAMPKKSGVYIIGDVTSGKSYVGSSSHLAKRLRQHQSELEKGKHPNPHLQNSFNAGHQFVVFPIPIVAEVDQLEVEQKILDEHFPGGMLLNIAPNAEAIWRGMKHTPETRALLSDIAKERGMPRATIEAGATARRGKKLSAEHVEIVRATSKARMTPEARANLSEKNTGIPHTPETIALMKDKCQGRTFSPKAQEALKHYHEQRRAQKLAQQVT